MCIRDSFRHSADAYERELVTCALVEDKSGRYAVDMADFEAKVSDPAVRVFFLCHPHNPTGRHWSDDELRAVANLCIAHDVLIISDEIHCDLLRKGRTHTPLAKLYPNYDKLITCMSSSKTFNLAGIGFAQVIIPNDEIRDAWLDNAFVVSNPISVAAATGVFANGEPWRQELLAYLDDNFAYVAETFAAELPEAVFAIPEATYLAWVNLSAYFPADLNLTRYFAEATGVLLEGGDMFVADADGHIRLNVACPRATLVDGLGRVIDAVKTYGAG